MGAYQSKLEGVLQEELTGARRQHEEERERAEAHRREVEEHREALGTTRESVARMEVGWREPV